MRYLSRSASEDDQIGKGPETNNSHKTLGIEVKRIRKYIGEKPWLFAVQIISRNVYEDRVFPQFYLIDWFTKRIFIEQIYGDPKE